METHPPRPGLALAVGIIGHRTNRLPSDPAKLAQIAKEISAVLAAIGREAVAAHNKYAEYFSRQLPVVAVVSGLAEGADRLGAQAAIELKRTTSDAGVAFELDVPLPFPIEVYEQDFKTDQSKSEFATLLKHCRYALTLPGERSRPGDSDQRAAVRENRSYEEAGLTLLNQSDLILAVWDGKPGAGRGGTRDLLDTAARAGTPIVHVDANCEAPIRVLWNGFDEFPTVPNAVEDLPSGDPDAALPDLMDKLLRPPEAEADLERRHLKTYYDKSLWLNNFGLAFPMLMALFCVRKPRLADWRPPTPEQLSADLVNFDQSKPPNAKLEQTSVLAAAFGWADAWGVWLAQVFRSAFVLNFSLAALAVVAAAVSLVWNDVAELMALHDQADIIEMSRELAHHKLPFVLIELFLIFFVVGITVIGYWRQWHRRWLEAREVAERLRIAFPLWSLGLRPTTFPAEEPAWTGWYTRCIVREQGMRPAILDGDGLRQSRDTLKGVLSDQCEYHLRTAQRMKKMENRLEGVGLLLFAVTLVVLIAFFLTVVCHVSLPMRVSFAVTGIAAGLPALATATFGIRVIGDFDGIARRSERTHQVLQGIIDAIEAEDPPSLASLRARARAGSDIMLGDVSSWRLAAESRTLPMP
jgi:hypothetical protein